MRDVVKTNVKREQSVRRKSRRRRHTPLYFFLVVVIVTGLGILLSVTLFFNVKSIDVKGDVDYSTEDIIRMSGISEGDNLIRLDTQKAADGILSSMIYIERALIEKQYPGTVIINVSRCVPTANIEAGSGYLIVSEKGKILEKTDKKYDNLFVIKGFESTMDTQGKYIESADEHKVGIALEFLKKFASNKKSRMAEVDITDRYAISVNYDDRIMFDMGNSNDISYKLSLAETVLGKIGNKKHGTMTMAGANQISFRENQSESNKESENKKDSNKSDTAVKKPIKPTEATEAPVQNDDWNDGNYDGGWYGGDENYDYGNYENDWGYEEDYGYYDYGDGEYYGGEEADYE